MRPRPRSLPFPNHRPNRHPHPPFLHPQMARESSATPLGADTYYEGEEGGDTWDEDMIYGCVCDSR